MTRADLGLALFLTIAAAGWSWFGSGVLGAQVSRTTFHNVWFDGDVPLVFFSMTNAGAYHRTSKHPLFFPLAYPPIKALRLIGLDHVTAARVVIAGWAGLFAALLFVALRASLPLHGAGAFTLLGLSTAAFVFWAPIPETLMLGSVTILCSLALIAWRDRLRHQAWLVFGVNVLTLGVTTLNWIAGLMASVVLLPLRRAVLVSACAFIFVAAIAFGQSSVLHTTGLFFIPSTLAPDVDYLTSTANADVLPKWRGLLVHAGAFPTPTQIPVASSKAPRVGLATQSSRAEPVAWVWLVFVAAGLFSVMRQDRAMVATVFAVLASQIAFHSVFGGESFLFSIHALPGLIVIASWSFTRWPRPVFIGCLVLAGSLAVHNVGRFIAAAQV